MDSATREDIRKVCGLFWADDFRSLHAAYMREDQRLFKARLWDYDDPLIVLNQGKDILEKIDPGVLSEDDRMWWYEIITRRWEDFFDSVSPSRFIARGIFVTLTALFLVL